MAEKSINVVVDISAPLMAKIEAAATEYSGKYLLDGDVCKRVLTVYDKFRKFVHQNDGGIKSTDVINTKMSVFVAELPSVDLYREGLELFSDLLGIVDMFDVSTTKDGDLSIKIGVTGLWKAV